MRNNLLLTSIIASSVVTTYPHSMTFLKLCFCVFLGIAIWRAIVVPVKKKAIKETISDYVGQVVLAIVSSYIIRKYTDLDDDFEFMLAGFVSGLFSYGLLLLYRWTTSPNFTEYIKNKYFKK